MGKDKAQAVIDQLLIEKADLERRLKREQERCKNYGKLEERAHNKVRQLVGVMIEAKELRPNDKALVGLLDAGIKDWSGV